MIPRTFSRKSNSLTTSPNTHATQTQDSHFKKPTITGMKLRKRTQCGEYKLALCHCAFQPFFLTIHCIYFVIWHQHGEKVLSNTILIKWAADECAKSVYV